MPNRTRAGLMALTLAQKNNSDGFPKAGEMIQLRSSSKLTLHDRRVLNLLVQHAGSEIANDLQHRISISFLRSPEHKGGEMVRDSIMKLMTTLVEVPTFDQHGNAATLRTTLLASTTTTDDESKPDGEVVYRFSKEMCEILLRSRYWGRIKTFVMFAFTSKYALTLYENLCLRRNLDKTEQEFDLETFRDLLGIPKGKLKQFPQMKQSAIKPAIEEINALSDFNVQVEPLRKGGQQRGKLLGFRVEWESKTPEAWKVVLDELQRPRIGRRARIRGNAEQVTKQAA